MSSTGITTVSPAQLGPAIAPYSQAAVANGFVYVAGQVALDPDNKVVAPDDIHEQTRYAIGRIRTILQECGSSLEHVVSATVYIRNLDDFKGFNDAWSGEFGEHRPARATVVAGLLLPGLVVEIQTIAVVA
jgi:2-iminobutanoate/2-iminopropanoate deaminase